MAELRPTTNLIVPEHLQLDKGLLKSGFLYVYNHGYTGLAPIFMTKLWASTIFPSLVNDPSFGTNRKGVKQAFTYLTGNLPKGYLSIRKVMDAKPYFVVSVPVFKFNSSSSVEVAKFLWHWFNGKAIFSGKKGADWTPVPDLMDETVAENLRLMNALHDGVEPGSIRNVTYSGQQVIANVKGLDANGRKQLEETLMQMRIQSKGSFGMVFLDFKMSAEIAQQLTSTRMIELRTVDLYPLLLSWCVGGWGYKDKPPITSFPMSAIAHSLPKGLGSTAVARINEDNISVGTNGKPFYIPREVDNSQKYEDLYTQAGSRADNTFSLLDINEGARLMELGDDPETKLPANIPVLIDWLNKKYAYTDTNGYLQVRELSRYRKPNDTMLVNMMARFKPDSKTINSWAMLGETGGVPRSAFKVLDSDVDEMGTNGFFVDDESDKHLRNTENIAAYFGIALHVYEANHDTGAKPSLHEISTNAEFTLFRPIARYLKLVDRGIQANLDAVYERYSVSYVSSNLPWIIMVSRYTDNMADIEAKDKTARFPALNQGVDPNWVPPSVPLLAPGIGILPHQNKVRNILKDSPDFAILPVQAGGGKSVLTILDVLYEIKANRSNPYLIMCPGHLVANYVSEIVFFTGGKLNVIAVSNFTFKENGVARLTQMLASAPRNTVVVVDYDCLTFRSESLCYGTTPIFVYPVIEFLRQFDFGYVALDESQKVKNKSQRTSAVASLIVDIPKKRLMSGTMVHDGPADLAMQIGMMDPTIFGSKTEFNEEYGLKVSGDRVVEWKPGFAQMIDTRIKDHVVVAGAMRKEWAALLPPKDERILGVTLSDEQMRVYNLIFEETIEQIREAAKSNSALAKFLENEDKAKLKLERGESDEADEETENDPDEDDRDDDEDGGEAIANALRPYLARIEQFTGAPGADPLGREVLKGEDLISPKIAKAHERVRAHIFGSMIEKADGSKEQYGPFKGKVLIFTAYEATAEAIFNLAPADLQACGLLYKAKSKMEDGARFETDDNIKWMVGISTSMEEGLNFQFASRLIRCEGIWNPGQLEQGNSRINRPELKKAFDERTKIFYDWLVANLTIDVTKLARLISKIIAVAKYENADNHEFEQLDDLPIIRMKLSEVQTKNDFFDTLEPYNIQYRDYRKIRDAEYDRYKQEYRDANNGEDPKIKFLESAAAPEGCALLSRVPYVPGMKVYGEDQEGLIRLDLYFKSPQYQEDLIKSGIVREPSDISGNRQLLQFMKEKRIHTQFGDGYCRSVQTLGRPDVTVDLDEGYSVRCVWASVYLVTRTETNGIDMRDGLLKAIGELPVTAPITVPAVALRLDKKVLKRMEELENAKKEKEGKKREKELKKALSLELQFTVVNGFLGISYNSENDTATKALQALGFRPTAPYYFTPIKKAITLRKQFDLWKEKGFTIEEQARKAGVANAIAELYNLLKSNQVFNHKDTYKWATNNQVKNFYRLEQKASNDKKAIKPYPLIQDDQAYLVLPINGQTASKAAIRYKASGVVWHVSNDEVTYFGLTPDHVVKMMKQIQEIGIDVTNIMDLRHEYQDLKKMKLRKGKANPDADLVLSSTTEDF